MNRARFRIRAIALAAAYAVALQGLLSAFVVPVAVASYVGVLCSGQSVDEPAAPVRHEPSCATACAMLGAVAALPPPAAVIPEPFVRAAHAVAPASAPLTAAWRSPQTARAPPSV